MEKNCSASLRRFPRETVVRKFPKSYGGLLKSGRKPNPDRLSATDNIASAVVLPELFSPTKSVKGLIGIWCRPEKHLTFSRINFIQRQPLSGVAFLDGTMSIALRLNSEIVVLPRVDFPRLTTLPPKDTLGCLCAAPNAIEPIRDSRGYTRIGNPPRPLFDHCVGLRPIANPVHRVRNTVHAAKTMTDHSEDSATPEPTAGAALDMSVTPVPEDESPAPDTGHDLGPTRRGGCRRALLFLSAALLLALALLGARLEASPSVPFHSSACILAPRTRRVRRTRRYSGRLFH